MTLRWLHRLTGRRPLSAEQLGPLERRAIEALWNRPEPASVRDLQPEFQDIAYTTLMTTLDRLYRKGLLRRAMRGRAFLYRPCLTRAELQSMTAAHALRTALGGADDSALRPLLSFFVDAVGDHDRGLLDELETLVRARRADLRKKP